MAELWLAFKALSIWGKLKDAIAWVFGSTTRTLIVALALALAWGWWERHSGAVQHTKDQKLLLSWQNAFKGEKAAYDQQTRNVDTLKAALKRKNEALDRLAKAGAAAQQRAEAAISAARETKAEAASLAYRLRADSTQRGLKSDPCATSDLLLSSKDKF